MSHQRYQTGDQALVRQINLSVILHQLREHAPISRAALAERTGLNKTTVSSLVSELIEKKFVREVGLELSTAGRGAGRLAMLLTLNPTAGYIVSGEIGVDFISVICTNFAPEFIWRYKENIDPKMGQRIIVERALALLLKASEVGRKHCTKLLGVAVGVPGLIDQASGTLLFAPNLGWTNTPLRKLLQESFPAPVFVANEANMAALGEHYFGVARTFDEVLYISAGVGLGGGIVHHGSLFSGVTGVGAEFGHMTMDPDGELCGCGNRGCWETQVSQKALFQYVRAAIQNGQSSSLNEIGGEQGNQLTVTMIVSAAEAGDAVAIQALHMLGHYLGIGIASLVNALNPDLVVIGGILSLADEFILPAIKQELHNRALEWNREATQVVIAKHGLDSCVLGGVALVYQAILAKPDNVGNWISSSVMAQQI